MSKAAARPHDPTVRVGRAVPALLLGLGAVLIAVQALRRRASDRFTSIPPHDEADESVALLVADLIGVARQGAKALRRAGMAMTEERLRLMLRDIAMERGHTAALLQQALREFGVSAVHGHQPTGDVVPEWMRVERVLTGGGADRILSAVAAAERATLDRFRQALGCPLPDDIRLILGERMFAELEPSRNRLSALSAAGTETAR